MIFGRFVCNRKGKGNSNSYSQDDKVKLKSFSMPNLADLLGFTLYNWIFVRRNNRNAVWGAVHTMFVVFCWFEMVEVWQCENRMNDFESMWMWLSAAVTWIWTANFYSRIFSDVSSFPICLVKWLGLKDLHFVFYRIQFKLPANEWNDTMPVVLCVLRYILKSSGVNTQSHWNAHLDKMCAWSAEIDRERDRERESDMTMRSV